jgi:hypothetical protein
MNPFISYTVFGHGHHSSDSITARNFSGHLEISSDLEVLLMVSWKTHSGHGFYGATLRSTAISLVRDLITMNSSFQQARHALCKLWYCQPLYFSSGLSISDVYIYIYIYIYCYSLKYDRMFSCFIRDPYSIPLEIYVGRIAQSV